MHNTEQAVALEVQGLNVYYGQAHALQDVSLSLGQGVLAVVGRNGMGKTTLCKAITGMVPGTGSIRFEGRELIGLASNDITHLGVAYVPQGRRVWRSLTVDETLQLAAKTARQGAWTVDRVYQSFPRLAERRSNGGGQLSGGEQQMLAIGRALLFNPRLLVMDEPTEGLAPVIVEQVANLLTSLAKDGSMSVLLIEQNLGVALEVADRIAVMVNGRIAHTLPAQALAEDRELQRRLLGVGTGSHDATDADQAATPKESSPVYTLVRRGSDAAPTILATFTLPPAPPASASLGARVAPKLALASSAGEAARPRAFKPATGLRRAAYVVGTFDTKSVELMTLRQCLDRRGLRTVTVDLSISAQGGMANVTAREVARHHPQGERAVFAENGMASIPAMAEAFANFVQTRDDLAGVISTGGTGGTALVLPAMQALPLGVPKVMVSSTDTATNTGTSDICLMHSASTEPGIHEQVLTNASHALAGMIEHPARHLNTLTFETRRLS
jgi:ABC-type branched-subunit amino acid transport system ATPase component